MRIMAFAKLIIWNKKKLLLNFNKTFSTLSVYMQKELNLYLCNTIKYNKIMFSYGIFMISIKIIINASHYQFGGICETNTTF